MPFSRVVFFTCRVVCGSKVSYSRPASCSRWPRRPSRRSRCTSGWRGWRTCAGASTRCWPPPRATAATAGEVGFPLSSATRVIRVSQVIVRLNSVFLTHLSVNELFFEPNIRVSESTGVKFVSNQKSWHWLSTLETLGGGGDIVDRLAKANSDILLGISSITAATTQYKNHDFQIRYVLHHCMQLHSVLAPPPQNHILSKVSCCSLCPFILYAY